MAIPIRKSDAACGAEIDFDLSRPLDAAIFGEIERAFHDNIVVCFRDQHLTNEQHIAFSRRFGELEIHIVKKYLLPGYPEILLISNIRDDRGEHIGLADAGFTWHSDTSYRSRPSRCSLLYAKEVPQRDGQPLGDTVFASTVAAYDALPQAMRRRLAGKQAIHRYAMRRRIEDSPRPKLSAAQLAETPDVAHPIVRTHPHTGRKALYVTAGECVGIAGMPEDEALDLIAELDEFCVRPEFCYRHRWRVGDLLMWDNASAMHLAICDYALPERRLMHRTTVIGAPPFSTYEGGGIAATEIELKLAARQRDLPALRRALEGRAVDHVALRARLVSTYFDTPDHLLASQGLALRVRASNGKFVQTVKSAQGDGPSDGPFGVVRGEWEDAVRGPAPDREAPATGRFIAGDIAGRLVPLFRTEIVRRRVELTPAPDTRIEAAIDRSRICTPASDIVEPVSEVELELKSGAASALYDVALDLLAVAPLRLDWRSKAERGYALAAAGAAAGAKVPAAVHAGEVRLEPGLSGDAALRRIGIACLDQLRRNEPAVLAGDPEGIHQMRVAVRRLRAILSAFGKLLPAGPRREASSELRWLSDALGRARNLDVFAQALLPPVRRALTRAAGIAVLGGAVEGLRLAAYAKARQAVLSPRYTGLLLRLLRWFDGSGWQEGAGSPALRQPILGIAREVLDRRRRVARRRGRGFAEQSAAQRHRLRIALKKLRYAAELLAALYDSGEVEGFIRRLKRLQDDLGDANDLRVGRDIVAELVRSRRRPGAIAAAGDAVLEWHERRLAKNAPQVHQHLDGLLAATPFWAR